MIVTHTELDSAALADLLSDAEGAELQAVVGPLYPDKGITSDSLLAYAAKCREAIERFKDGGAHRAVVKGIAL